MSDWNKDFDCKQCQHWHDRFKDAMLELQHSEITMPIAEEIKPNTFYTHHQMYSKEMVTKLSRDNEKLKEENKLLRECVEEIMDFGHAQGDNDSEQIYNLCEKTLDKVKDNAR